MRPHRSRSGSALVEFAGSLVLLATLFTGIFQTGYTFFAYATLVNAVRAGARYASMQPAASSQVNPEFGTEVRNMVVYGDPRPAAGAQPLVSGLAPTNVELILGPGSATVSVRGFVLDAMFARVTLDGRPTVTFPVTGGAAP